MIWRVRQEIEDALWAAAKRCLPPGALARKRLVSAIVDRTRLYTSERELLGDAGGGPVDLAARALFFTVADAAKIGVPLAELRGAGLLSGERLHVLDAGAGAGAMSLGLLSFLTDRDEHPAIALRAVDSDAEALRLMTAAFAILRERLPAAARTDLATEPLALERFAPAPASVDLVLAGSVLNELSEDAAAALVERLMAAVRPDGALVIVEPALRETSRRLHALRDRVVERGVASVFAPCTRRTAPCPALADERDWCHDERPIELPEITNQLSVATGLRDGLMKMSYLVLLHRDVPLVDAGELLPLRVVSRPRRGKGERDMFVCGSAGRRRLRLQKRERSADTRILERARRGDVALIPAERDDPELVDVRRGDRVDLCRPADGDSDAD